MTKVKSVKGALKKRAIKNKLVSMTKAKNVIDVVKKRAIKKKLASISKKLELLEKAKNDEDVGMKENDGITIKKKVIKDAISVLKKVHENFSEGQSKKPLLENSAESPIFLQITLKKIPPKKMKSMFRIKLPHALMTDTTEVCLITGDLDKKDMKADYEPTVLHYKELLNKHGVTQIKQVIPLRQLRTEYKTFETRRQLSAAYDVFLNDKKITGVLPRALGKSFYESRKFPIQFNLNSPNLKDHIERALSETVFSMTCRGNSCTSEVARLSMTDKDILENILVSVKSLEAMIPGKGINILGIYIKTARSQAIPIYMSFGNPNGIKLKAPKIKQKVKFEELSTLDNAEVKVFRDGRIQVKYTPGSGDEGDSDEEESRNLEQEEELNSKEIKEVKEEIKYTPGSEDEENSDEEESRNLKQEEELNSKESQEVKEDIKEELNSKESQGVTKEINFNEKHSKTKKRVVVKNEGKGKPKGKRQKPRRNRGEIKYTPDSEDEENSGEAEEEGRNLKQEKELNSKESQEVKVEIKEELNSKESQEVTKEINFNEKHSKTKKRMVVKNEGKGKPKGMRPKRRNKGKANEEKIMNLEVKQVAHFNADKSILKRNKVVKNQDTTVFTASNEVAVSNKNEESKVDKIKAKKRKSLSQNIKNGQAAKVNSAKRLKLH